jgi:hypothetical protein
MIDRNVNGVDVLDIEGRIVLGEESNAFREKVKTLKLVNLGTKFKEVLQVTKLMTVFDTYDSETAAIHSFGA